MGDAENVRRRLVAGDSIHMGFAGGKCVWWFERPYQPVSNATMSEVLAEGNGGPLIEESGDCLFGWERNSQTWRSVYS